MFKNSDYRSNIFAISGYPYTASTFTDDEGGSVPSARECPKNEIYMDDVLSEADAIPTAIENDDTGLTHAVSIFKEQYPITL